VSLLIATCKPRSEFKRLNWMNAGRGRRSPCLDLMAFFTAAPLFYQSLDCLMRGGERILFMANLTNRTLQCQPPLYYLRRFAFERGAPWAQLSPVMF